MYQYANNQVDTLNASITDTATEIFVNTPVARPVPTTQRPILMTLVEGVNTEIVWAHASADQGGNVTKYTVIRGAEGTTPRAFSAATNLEIRYTAKSARRNNAVASGDLILTQDEDILTQDGNVLTFDDVSFAATTS